MNRSPKNLIVCLVATVAISVTACGGKSLSVHAERPWEALPGDVAGVIHLDMNALLQAELLRSMGESFGDMPAAPLMMLNELEEATGFDMQRDLRSVTVGADFDASGEPGPYFAVVRGVFDLDKIEPYLESSPNAHPVEVNGIVTYETLNPTNPMAPSPAVAWLDAMTLIAANPADMPRFLKAVGGKISTVADTPMAQHMATSSDQAFMVINVPEDAFSGPNAAMMASVPEPLQRIQTILIGVNVSSNLDLSVSVLADNEQDGEVVESTLQSFLQMGKMMVEKDPEAAELLDSLVVSRQGKAVRLSMQLSDAQIQQAMAQAAPMMMAQAMPGMTPDFPVPGSQVPLTVRPMAPTGSTDPAVNPSPQAASLSTPSTELEPDTEAPDEVEKKNRRYTRKRSSGREIKPEDYAGAVGKWVQITNTDGLEMKVRLTGVDEDALTFEKKVSGGTMVMTLERSEIETMHLVQT